MNQHVFAAMREAMIVSQLRTVGVNDPRLLAAFKTIPREHYVPEQHVALAYVDGPIPLSNNRALNIPMTTGRLIAEASVKATDTVMLIGAATGYAAAVLAQLVTQVVAVEEDSALSALMVANVDTPNIVPISGPLSAGCAAHASYDAIIIDGAVEHIPPALIAQLKVGGRLTCGLVDHGVSRLMIGRKSAGGFGLLPIVDAACVVLPGFALTKGFQF